MKFIANAAAATEKMRLSRILHLPTCLLLLVLSHTNTSHADEDEQSAAQWPYNLPPHVKYWPEDPPHRRRALEVIEENFRLGRSPVAVKKMGTDQGELFYMEYWQFEEGEEQSAFWDIAKRALPAQDLEQNSDLPKNIPPYLPPFALHGEHHFGPPDYTDLRVRGLWDEHQDAAGALARLGKRQFSCPGGTSNCAAIGYPNSCCGFDQTCFVIQDTGLGPVGCCPKGSSCGGAVNTCATPNTACPDNLGGGCCIPNYVCSGVGCVLDATAVITVTIVQSPSVTTQTATTTNFIVTPPVTTTVTDTGLQTTLACTSNFHACPVDLGGGCCPSGRLCGLLTCGLPPGVTETIFLTSAVSFSGATTTGTGVPAARPTAATTSAPPVVAGSTCAPAYYACNAYYPGQCCQIGRDCSTSNCAATAYETIITGGQTIVVPVGPAATLNFPTGTCAVGWTSCAPSVGGDCCPSGWDCGTASCRLSSPTKTQEVQKSSPNHALRSARGSVGGVVVGFVMALLLMEH